MAEQETFDRDRVFVVEPQAIVVEDRFGNEDRILDLGGGGEGVIGQLRGHQVVAIDKRKDELEECAAGPLKVIADARDLPFLDAAFDAATAFFFLMYVPTADRAKVLSEARRVLKPGGVLHVWDATIPPKGEATQETFIIFVRAQLPDRTISTGYGVSWAHHELSASSIGELAKRAGFELVNLEESGETFRLTLRRPASG
jgi:ubiquinone/menaquinone biosynthesis C-methylase UbiE